MILTVTANPSIDKTYVVDNITVGAVQRVKECIATIGGKGLNVSKVAKKLGADVTATGFLGGRSGQFIRDGLKEYNIEDAFTETGADTRSCINIMENNGVSTEFLEPGALVKEEFEQEFYNNFKKIVKFVDVVTISGSTPKGVSQEFYCNLIKIAKENGVRTIFDSSGKLLKKAISAKPYMIKPNIDEISQLCESDVVSDEDIIREGKKLVESGIEVVCVTLGKRGSLVITKDKVINVEAPKIKALSPVGSGDSFVAGMAYGLSLKHSLEDCLKSATAVASANAMTLKTGDFDPENYKNNLKNIKITIL